VFSPLQDNVYIPSQRISWINKADNSKLLVQTPKFITETYGIPRDGVFYTTDKSRSFYKLPLCHERKQHPEDVDYSEINEFYAKMKELDAYFSSDEFKRTIFGGKNINKYEYQPIVREPTINEDDNDEDDVDDLAYGLKRARMYNPPFIKLKIDLDNVTECPNLKLFNKTENGREVIAIDKFKDITDHMRYLTKVRFVILIHRLYVMKNQVGDKKRYGICIKIIAAECENKVKKQLERSDVDFIDFIN